MNFKLALSALALGTAFALTSGCTAESTDGTGEASGEIIAHPASVVGAYRLKSENPVGGPAVTGIVFNENNTFFADVDTGIQCIMAPCPSAARLEGTYKVIPLVSASGFPIELTSKDGTDGSGLYGRYTYSVGPNNTLRLSKGDSWVNILEKVGSYCGAPTDCEAQNPIHPMCFPGAYTCSAQNTCGYSCGSVPPPAPSLYPADTKQLVAENKGGGHTAPAPAGSTCAMGAQKYTLELATSTVSWEVCAYVDSSTPMQTRAGQRALTAAEVKTIDAAMKRVKVSNGEMCGADKPMLEIAVTSASQGTKTYTDSFYSCMEGNRTYVDNIDGVFSAFRAVAH